MSVDHIANIRTKLLDNTDANKIMVELLDKFNTTKEFKTALCHGQECKMFFPQGYAPTNPLIQTQLWRLHHKITAICKDTTCDIAAIKDYYNQLANAKKLYNNIITSPDPVPLQIKAGKRRRNEKEEQLTYLLEELSSLHLYIKSEMSGGGNQKGGVLVETIINLIAGFDVISLTISTMELTEYTYNKICDLCSYVAEDISKTSDCMKSIMGDTLYKGIKIVAKSIFGAGAIKIIYNNIGSLISALFSIVKYVPAAAQLLGVLSVGFVVSTYIDSVVNNANKQQITQKFEALIDRIDTLTSADIETQFTELLTKLKTHLEKEKKDEIEQMYGQLPDMLRATHLSPDAIAEQSTVDARFDNNFKKTRRNILLQLIAKFNKKYITSSQAGPNIAMAGPNIAMAGPNIAMAGPNIAMAGPNIAINEDSLRLGNSIVALWGAIQIDDTDPTISAKVLPFITQFEEKKAAMGVVEVNENERNIPVAVESNIPVAEVVSSPVGFSHINDGGKTHKKINKKTNKKPHKKNNKKSRKHRRSRKH